MLQLPHRPWTGALWGWEVGWLCFDPGVLASMLSEKDGKEGEGRHKPPFSTWKLLVGSARILPSPPLHR